MNKNLIYDLGFFNGDDTDYYLKKGYNVIAIEANPNLFECGKLRFKEEIKSKKLILLNNAFTDTNEQIIKFYIHPKNLDWGTCLKEKAEYWKVPLIHYDIHDIQTINLSALYNKYGCPYYIKTDIEGLDYLVLTQLMTMKHKPIYLSFELSRLDYYKTFMGLLICEYTGFLLINQLSHVDKIDESIGYKFGNYHSGFFGMDIFKDVNKNLNYDECLTRYIKYKELKIIDNQNLALGWIDIHAKL